MQQSSTAKHDALQRGFAVDGPDGGVWPVWIVDVAEAEHKAVDLVSTIWVRDCGDVLTWRHIAPPMLTALGGDYTGLPLYCASSVVGGDVRRVCLTAAHSGAPAVLFISWPDLPSGSAQHLMAWPSPGESEVASLEIQIVILPASTADTPSLFAVPPAGIFAEVTHIRM